MITTVRSKVKLRSHHDAAHLHPPNQCAYLVSTSYTLEFFQDIAHKRFYMPEGPYGKVKSQIKVTP